MSDEQLKRKSSIKKILILSGVLLLASVMLMYFRYATNASYQTYQSQKAQEGSVRDNVMVLSNANSELLVIIEENGKELVSFSEDKIKYINLASELSIQHGVTINKLTVSDVWNEGEMSGMTTSIEVEGDLTAVKEFIEDYCSTEYTNRINVVSCRPAGRYAWLERGIDGENALTWFDLGPDQAMYEEQENVSSSGLLQLQAPDGDFGLPITNMSELDLPYTYDAATGKFVYSGTSVAVDQDTLDETPITLEKMFADSPMKAYLVIDFLGRA